MPISHELGEPDESFYNLWKEECEELWEEEDELWGDEDVEEELSLRHPGFNKWTVQQGAAGGDHIRAKDKNFYCFEVQVKYDACLMDGTSVSKSEGVEFSLTDGFFCPAFAHAVHTMKEGEEAVLIVKPKYAFGEQGRPSQGEEAAVPPDATLYVHLLFVCWIRRIGEDQAIAKKTLRIGNSQRIHTQSQAVVKVRLLGKLQDGTVFDRRGYGDDEPFEFVVDEGQVIDGLDESVMTMEEGEVAEFTIPPQHAFDAVGSDQHQFAFVPRNATVVYKIELLSVVNEKHPLYIPSRDEIVEYASRKEEEGDIYFNLGKHLRAHRRYFKARQIIEYSRFGVRRGKINLIKLLSIPTSEIDAQLEEMWISCTFKAAKCAIQLGCYMQASCYYSEVLNYDVANVQAQQQQTLLQEFPDGSSRDPDAMQRGFEQFPPEYESELQLNATFTPAAFSPRRKGEHPYRGEIIGFPDVQANSSQPASTPSTAPSTPNPATPQTNALATGTSGTPSGSAAQSSGTINTNRGFLFRCFGPSPTS
ncbi:70 kDa peptidyl-prolyl isomerase isoform X4 [Oryza sativa Japonica Group]|uniref:70 kDa peptidyl-prolyl isomerase isoform X4 n=1 Tax=Oryza sativa subsp. japonica TaxID=39947 RepID=UPI00339CD826